MIFVRISINHDTGSLAGVVCQDTPFNRGGRVELDDAPCQLMDLGCLDMAPAGSASIVRQAIEHAVPDLRNLNAVEICEHARLMAMPTKCSLSGIKQQLRDSGPTGVPMKVRAWLTLTLPDHELRALGPIWRGIPLSVLAVMERVRNRRDPDGGSRIEVIEREIQRRSDTRSAIALSRRQADQAAASAWQDMLTLIGDNDGQALAHKADR